MASRANTGRVLAHHKALLPDAVQQPCMAGGVWDVDAAGEHRDGEPVGRQGGAVRGAVDSIRTARHHRHVPLDEARRQVGSDVLPVCTGCPRPHQRDGALRHLVEAGRADDPQHQRRTSLRARPEFGTGECGEGQQWPLRIVGRHQASALAGEHIQIVCRAVNPTTRLGPLGETLGDLARLDTLGGLDRSKAVHQRRQLGTRRFGHPRQVCQSQADVVGHCTPSGCRKLSAVVTSSRPGDVRPAKSASVHATANATFSQNLWQRGSAFHAKRLGPGGGVQGTGPVCLIDAHTAQVRYG